MILNITQWRVVKVGQSVWSGVDVSELLSGEPSLFTWTSELSSYWAEIAPNGTSLRLIQISIPIRLTESK